MSITTGVHLTCGPSGPNPRPSGPKGRPARVWVCSARDLVDTPLRRFTRKDLMLEGSGGWEEWPVGHPREVHLPPQEPRMLLPDSSPLIPRLEEVKMRGGNIRAHKESPSTAKQRIEEDAMTPDNEPSATENFSKKSTRRVKDATLAATSSPAAPAT
jgi:hypothetical protein